MNTEQLIKKLGDAKDYEEGAYFITGTMVCKSNAGYFVGTECITATSGMWLPEVYSRDSEYMSKGAAERTVRHYTETEIGQSLPVTAAELVDIIKPEHDRTSCSDVKLDNVGRCGRCSLLATAEEGQALEGLDYGIL